MMSISSMNAPNNQALTTPPHAIMIFGRPGSGKSTFAHDLHTRTGLPVYHLDAYFYKEKWHMRNATEFLTIQKKLVDTPFWIIDGNNKDSLELRYSKADVVLYFDYPLITCLYRLIKRRFYKNKDIEDRPAHCPEHLSWSLIQYVVTFKRRMEKTIAKLRRKYPDTPFITIQCDKELEAMRKQLLTFY